MIPTRILELQPFFHNNYTNIKSTRNLVQLKNIIKLLHTNKYTQQTHPEQFQESLDKKLIIQ